MKKLLLALVLISATACASDLYPPAPGGSLEELEAWAQPRFASGTETPPVASAAEGEWFINTATPSQTALQIKVAGAWRSIAGGSGTGTSNHAELSNLDYANSGHTGFQPAGAYQLSASMADYLLANTAAQEYQPIASMGVYALGAAIPRNGSFTLAGLSEKDFSSLTGKPTAASYPLSGLSSRDFSELTGAPTNSSYTLAGLSNKDFSSLANKPTTIAGYGLTDAASTGTNLFSGNQTLSDGAVLEIATGSSNVPSLRFRSDPNTGLAIGTNGADSLSFVLGGIQKGYWTVSGFQVNGAIAAFNAAAGGAFLPNYAAASQTPVFVFTGNTNTGLGRNAIGEPSMVASGTEAQRWSASGSMILSNTYITPEGGRAVRMTASGTATFNRGDIVCLSRLGNEPKKVTKVELSDVRPIGAVWGGVDGAQTCNVGSDCWVITDGIGYVKLDTVSNAVTNGGVLLTSSTDTGCVEWSASDPNTTVHWREFGHSCTIGSPSAVIQAIIHFN